MGGVVVGDQVKLHARVGLGDLLEELEELLVAVPVEAGIEHLSSRDLERDEQRGGAMADAVVGGLLG